jgi:RNase P/RNase MRP subunit p30
MPRVTSRGPGLNLPRPSVRVRAFARRLLVPPGSSTGLRSATRDKGYDIITHPGCQSRYVVKFIEVSA